jgi:hypothetical protein
VNVEIAGSAQRGRDAPPRLDPTGYGMDTTELWYSLAVARAKRDGCGGGVHQSVLIVAEVRSESITQVQWRHGNTESSRGRFESWRV